ncbi:MAG: hypothetical protein WAK17_14365, partial [Candidatus Nitrosopolaris sp.]
TSHHLSTYETFQFNEFRFVYAYNFSIRRSNICLNIKPRFVNDLTFSLPQPKCLADFLDLDQKAGQGKTSLPHS